MLPVGAFIEIIDGHVFQYSQKTVGARTKTPGTKTETHGSPVNPRIDQLFKILEILDVLGIF